jgi:hypothetical protein
MRAESHRLATPPPAAAHPEKHDRQDAAVIADVLAPELLHTLPLAMRFRRFLRRSARITPLDMDGHAQRAGRLDPELNVVGQRRSRIRGEGVEPEGFSGDQCAMLSLKQSGVSCFVRQIHAISITTACARTKSVVSTNAAATIYLLICIQQVISARTRRKAQDGAP